MPSRTPYLCAFTGRRDSYQVAIALQERGLLENLITDFYTPAWLRRVGPVWPAKYAEKLNNRRAPELDDAHVTSLLGWGWRDKVRQCAGIPRNRRQALGARDFGREIARRARGSRAHLLVYHSYAWESFTSHYPHQPQRVLFQYHPHMDFEQTIYQQDAGRHPDFASGHTRTAHTMIEPVLLDRIKNAWRHADLILCASSFTKQSLVWAGADPAHCRVVPYGNSAVCDTSCESPPPEIFHALFVGSGCLRKGLHHLLRAWPRMKSPQERRLVLVCRDIAPELRRLAESTPGVQIRPGVSSVELARLYAQSHLFVLPSLVEGFAQVYLEAMTYGCPVLGTPNTALPDLGTEADGIYMVGVGEVEELTAKLEVLGSALLESQTIRQAAQRCASARPWTRFRQELIDTL